MSARSALLVLAANIGFWFAVQVGAGYLVHRLSDEALARDRWLFRARPFERGGRLYSRTFRVDRWKRWLPEGGGAFRGGFDKRRLPGRSTELLERYVRETRRAELGHWLAVLPLPICFLWNPAWAWPVMASYAVAVNAPCVISQRYVRLRMTRVLARRSAR